VELLPNSTPALTLAVAAEVAAASATLAWLDMDWFIEATEFDVHLLNGSQSQERREVVLGVDVRAAVTCDVLRLKEEALAGRTSSLCVTSFETKLLPMHGPAAFQRSNSRGCGRCGNDVTVNLAAATGITGCPSTPPARGHRGPTLDEPPGWPSCD
jgi:hypothetical protein